VKELTTLSTSVLEELTQLGRATSVELVTQASPSQVLSAVKGERALVSLSSVRPGDSELTLRARESIARNLGVSARRNFISYHFVLKMPDGSVSAIPYLPEI
jgi:hypothetical protein